jgi:hypothetical protein
MRTPLFIAVKNPFTIRDHERMGIDDLAQLFDLTILDCSAWLMPVTYKTRSNQVLDGVRVVCIRSLSDLKRALIDVRDGFALDYVGQFSVEAILLFHQLKRYGQKIVVVDSGAMPVPKEWSRPPISFRTLIYAVRSQFLGRALRGAGRKLLLRLLPDQSPDLALVSGISWMSNTRFVSAKLKIPSHSFDYEKFRRVNLAPPVNNPVKYALYLDESLPFHEDNSELGFPSPVSPYRFGDALRGFFSKFEAATGLPVKIAGYPSTEGTASGEFFGNRELVFRRTAELVRSADIVFAHGSTSISFAVLWRCPLVFLTTPELSDSWYFPWVRAMADVLHSPLIDIENDLPAKERVDDWFRPNLAGYMEYEATYLRAANAPNMGLWDILSNGVEEASGPAGILVAHSRSGQANGGQ